VNLMRLKDGGGVSGSGVLVTLTFQVVGRGSAAVTAQGVTLKNSKAETILSGSPQAAIQVK